MKKISYVLYSAVWLVLLACTFSLSSCEDDPTAEQVALKQLTAGPWTLKNVTVDGVNKNDLFTGFSIQFTKPNLFTTTNGDPVWPATGVWEFKDKTAQTVVRDDGKEITITSLTATSVTLTMMWDKTTFGTGRVNSVSGMHVFELTR